MVIRTILVLCPKATVTLANMAHDMKRRCSAGEVRPLEPEDTENPPWHSCGYANHSARCLKTAENATAAPQAPKI